MTQLRTRKPTGARSWPVLLVEGPEKCGRTRALAELSACDRLGQTYWLDIGHGTADEYAAVPGADYEIVDHDGSYADILGQIAAVSDEAARALADGELPVVLIINSMTALWDAVKNWAHARVQASAENRRRLILDPFAEINLGDAGWNEANGRHARIMRLLLTFPGVVVLTARGRWVTPLGTDGAPAGAPIYRVDAHKGLPGDASCWIRLDREAPPLIVGARAPHLDLGTDPLPLDPKWSLEQILFDFLELDPAQTGRRPLVPARTERTPKQIASAAAGATYEQLGALYDEARSLGYDEVSVRVDGGREESLLSLISRLGQARKPDAPAIPAHLTRISNLWEQCGGDFADAASRTAFVQEITGREVRYAKGLTNAEAEAVIARLEAHIHQAIQPDPPPPEDAPPGDDPSEGAPPDGPATSESDTTTGSQ